MQLQQHDQFSLNNIKTVFKKVYIEKNSKLRYQYYNSLFSIETNTILANPFFNATNIEIYIFCFYEQNEYRCANITYDFAGGFKD